MFCAENSGFCARVPLCLCGNAARRAMRTRAAPKAGKRRRVRHHRRAGGKKAGPARGARAQTARAPFCFGLPHRHHHAFCRLTAAGAAVAPQKGRRARPVRALPPAPGPGPQPEKRTQQKPPAPGAGAGGSSFVRPGPGCSVFRCARFCTKKQSPPCRLRQTKTYLFGRWVPCHGFHAPFFRNGGRSAIPPRTPSSR